MNKKKISNLLVAIFTGIFFVAGIAYPAEQKGSAVEGRVVGSEGSPLTGVRVVARLPVGQHVEGYELFESQTGPDGRFIIAGLYPGMYYRIFFDGGQCNDLKDRVRSLPDGETMKLRDDYVLVLSHFRVSPEGVIRDLLTGLEWTPLSVITINNYERAASYASSREYDGGNWRLPTVEELEDLLRTGQRGCGLDVNAFGSRYPKVWASDRKSRSKQWVVTFHRDNLDTERWDEASGLCDDCRVLSVRSSQR